MIIFKSIKHSFEALSLYPSQPNENRRYNSINLAIQSIFFVSIITSGIFFFYEAKTLLEYSDSFYSFTTAIGTSVFFAVLVWKKSKIFALIGKYEATIEKRK